MIHTLTRPTPPKSLGRSHKLNFTPRGVTLWGMRDETVIALLIVLRARHVPSLLFRK